MLEIFGQIPLVYLLLLGIIVIVIAWKVIKFAIKIFVALLIFFGVLIGLDMLGIFQWIQQMLSNYL
ncbi:hypothetical protein B6U98_01225 [Thermoplasmatales archaeon ex4572_165]|nr:MAG: hypothetical protein B6U98_01225 [Thermoplasmatales archaeon ex4572_165]RLF59873.1 MAG: hypothetical protein DRN27_01305 [Thermoplasmata archaeon]